MLHSFMENGTMDQKATGSSVLQSVLEDKDVRLGERLSAAGALNVQGTKQEKERMKKVLLEFQKQEIFSGFAEEIRRILIGDRW